MHQCLLPWSSVDNTLYNILTKPQKTHLRVMYVEEQIRIRKSHVIFMLTKNQNTST